MFALDIEDVFVASWKRFSSSLGQVVLLTLLYLVGVFVVLAPLIFMFFCFSFLSWLPQLALPMGSIRLL